jgi:hypothetical protein
MSTNMGLPLPLLNGSAVASLTNLKNRVEAQRLTGGASAS